MNTLTLRWTHSGHPHERSFSQGEHALIGRGRDCNVRLPSDDRTVHRKHAEIVWEGGAPVLRVLGRNGAVLSSAPRKLAQGKSARIARKDRMTLGETQIESAYASADQGKRKLECHNCSRVVDYTPEGMCVHCGFALVMADTVYIRD